jgi:SAM-dependent methyltransferase
MAESIVGAWWERLRGRLRPRPCPYSLAAALEIPGRRLLAGPRGVLTAFGISSGTTVLEIGPGTGFYSLEAARRVGPSGRLICLDLQPEMLLHTRRRIAGAGYRASFVRADAQALPLRSGNVDQVFLITVLGEIPDRAATLAEIRRVLRASGRLSVCEQFPDPDFVTTRTMRRELAEAGFVEQKTQGRLVYTSTWSSMGRVEFESETSRPKSQSVGDDRDGRDAHGRSGDHR